MKARKRDTTEPPRVPWLLRKPVAVPPALNRDRDTVFIERPRCPVCESASLKTLRSIADQGDGTSARRTACRKCGHRFTVVVE